MSTVKTLRPGAGRRERAYQPDDDRTDEQLAASGLMRACTVPGDEVVIVTRDEASAGLLRYAHSLGQGTPACAVWERRALVLAGYVPLDAGEER